MWALPAELPNHVWVSLEKKLGGQLGSGARWGAWLGSLPAAQLAFYSENAHAQDAKSGAASAWADAEEPRNRRNGSGVTVTEPWVQIRPPSLIIHLVMGKLLHFPEPHFFPLKRDTITLCWRGLLIIVIISDKWKKHRDQTNSIYYSSVIVILLEAAVARALFWMGSISFIYWFSKYLWDRNCASHRDTVINKTEPDSDCRAIIQKSETVIVHAGKEKEGITGTVTKREIPEGVSFHCV